MLFHRIGQGKTIGIPGKIRETNPVRVCAARQGVLFKDMCSLRVYFLPIFLSVFSLVCFSTSASYVFPQGIQSQGFFNGILCSLSLRVR